MNTIKMSKVLALIVVVAMVMAVMPVAFAAGEEVGSTNFYGWDFGAGAIRDNVGVDTAEAAVVSWGNDRVSFVEFTLPEGTTVEEGQFLQADISFMAYGNEGQANSTVATIFATDPVAVESKDNAQLTTAREAARNVKVGTIAFDFTAKDVWNDAPSVGTVVVPAASVKDGKVAFMLSNRKEDGADRNGIATLKEAKLSNIRPVEPASVTVQYADGDKVFNENVYSVEGLYSTNQFTPVAPDAYIVDGKNLYQVGTTTVTLEPGVNIVKIPVTLYKTIVGNNIITNPSFENGMEGWTTVDGANLADAVKADDGSDQFEIVGDIAADEDANPPVAAQKRTTDGAKALWLKGGAVGNSKAGTAVDTSWTVKPNTTYYVSFDFMSTLKDDGTQYMWFYATDSAEQPSITYYAEALDKNSQQLQQMNVHPHNVFETKRFLITTGETENKIGFGGAWFINDASPIVDNFQLYELQDLDTDVKYSIVVTDTGKEDGKVLGEKKGLEGTVGEAINVEKGSIVNNQRNGKAYVSNVADTTTKLDKDHDKYYVGVETVATIIGAAEEIKAKTVAGYDPFLPSKVVPKLDKEVEGLTPEAIEVKWDGTTGTLADTDVTVTAEVETLTEAFDPIAGTVVSSELIQQGSLGNQKDAWNDTYKFPAALNTFTAAFTITYNKDGDNHILFMSSADTPGENNAFASSHAHIKISADGIQVRNADSAGGGLHTVIPVEEGKTYQIIVDYNNDMYDVYARNVETGEVGVFNGAVARTAGPIDGVSFVGNLINNPLYGFTVTDAAVAAKVDNVPAAGNVTANLDYFKDGENADTLVINFTADVPGATLKIYANDQHNNLVGTAVVEEGKSIALVPQNANITYTARLVDTDTGFMIGGTTAALYPMVVADIEANLNAYIAEDAELARVDKAVTVLSQGGAVDPKAKFITVDTTSEEGATIITLDDALFKKGFGFKGVIKAGTAGAVKDTPEKAELYNKITIKGDEVTLENADSVVTFSLDSVEIEFVATDIVESDADNAGAEADFIPEL